MKQSFMGNCVPKLSLGTRGKISQPCGGSDYAKATPDKQEKQEVTQPAQGYTSLPVVAKLSDACFTPLAAFSLFASSSSWFGLPFTTTISKQLS